ncbi:MAG: cytidylate kinase-like family protein [Rectinemataceae bacterium]|jgi:cytidylate kinase
MAIITIARELAALGEEVSRELSRLTNYKLIDREYLEKRLADYGLDTGKRDKYDEKKPGFWASLSQERDDYLHFLKSALYEEAIGGDCIVVGRGGAAVFKSVPSLVAVKLVSSLALRIERVMKSYACDERHALQIVEESDHNRIGFHKYFFSVNWQDSRTFDLTINSIKMEPAQAAELIDHFRKIFVEPAKEEAGKRRLAELLLGQRVVTEIVYAKKIPVHFLEAAADGAHVMLHGVANTQSAIDAALAAARSVPGVAEAESVIQVVQEFTVMP